MRLDLFIPCAPVSVIHDRDACHPSTPGHYLRSGRCLGINCDRHSADRHTTDRHHGCTDGDRADCSLGDFYLPIDEITGLRSCLQIVVDRSNNIDGYKVVRSGEMLLMRVLGKCT